MITSFFTFLRAAVVILDSLSGFMEARVVLGVVENTLVKVGMGKKAWVKEEDRESQVQQSQFLFLGTFFSVEAG